MSSGIGKALVLFYLDRGCRVVGFARSKKAIRDMNEGYDGFDGYVVDISDRKGVDVVFSVVKKKYSDIDVLINNAGIFESSCFRDSSLYSVDRVVDVNLKGLMYCTFHILDFMCCKDKRYNIINIGSVSGLRGIMHQAVYSASKHGIRGFSDSLQQELRLDGNIIVSTLYLGGVDTELWDKADVDVGNRSEFLKTGDVCSMVDYILGLPDHVVLKDVTLFPGCEFH